jgi:hypothetical protein
MYENLPAAPSSAMTEEDTKTEIVPSTTYQSGWYPDPYGGLGLRYFDGNEWTMHRHTPPVETVATPVVAAPTAAPAGQQIVVNTYVAQSAGTGIAGGPKSPVLAFVLTFFFGPIGMLYSTVVGALVMFVVGLVVVPLTFGLALPLLWPIQLVWAVVAANNASKGGGGNANAGPGAGGFANQVSS